MRLPIDDVLPELIAALRKAGRAVLEAPPGAGKTTRVPLALRDSGLTAGRIIVLEPRRIAARAAAARMAETLGEPLGQTVGYRIRGESRVSKDTQIEVVTEGILTRMIQSDPELAGIGAVLFDEFHERSLNADLGLALCLEIAGALRDDLILIAMSATLDTGAVADLMQAPVVTSQGRSYPVDIRHLDRPIPPRTRLDSVVADQVRTALSENDGGILVFLPGEGEIRRTAAALQSLPADVHLRPLFGAMKLADQRAAIRPEPAGRKVVLATAIAETSLTIEDVRVVIDAGKARRARFDPGSGMARLVTERVSKAEATQRAGRAGRVAPGVAYRLWTPGENGALPAQAPAEIEIADLAPFALELALWGAEPDALPLLTPPPAGAWAEARALLTMLGALDRDGRITAHGRRLAGMPLHPRLAHMLAVDGPRAAPIAALLSDRDPLRGSPVDLGLRLRALRDPKPYPAAKGALAAIRAEAERLEKLIQGEEPTQDTTPARSAALAYPDRIGMRRKGNDPRYLLSGGKGAVMDADDPMAGAPLIVVTDTDGAPRDARIRQAIAITEPELRALFDDQVGWENLCLWSRRDRKVLARRQERLGALVLADRPWTDAPPEALAAAMCTGIRDLGLTLPKQARRFVARVELARMVDPDMPDLSEPTLLERLETWLAPYLAGVTTAEAWRQFDPLPALQAMLTHAQQQALDRSVPRSFTTPLGRAVPIDYDGDTPEIAIRLQELFGQTRHPQVGGRPLKITLLSPAQRPVQVTMDLPGFWAGSYADVRKDMRARYPKHPWPEDPTQADPTLRAKPRK